LRQGKALRASKENIEFVSKKKVELNKINDETKNQFKEIALKITNKILKFNKESKENGELYGSIKPKEVSSAFKTVLEVEINPSQIDLRQEITKIGKYKININLHAEVTVNVNLSIDKVDSI
jgi:large subunit ribosomal protein L9